MLHYITPSVPVGQDHQLTFVFFSAPATHGIRAVRKRLALHQTFIQNPKICMCLGSGAD